MREGINPHDVNWNRPKYNFKKADHLALLEKIDNLEKRIEKLEKKKLEKKKVVKKKAE